MKSSVGNYTLKRSGKSTRVASFEAHYVTRDGVSRSQSVEISGGVFLDVDHKSPFLVRYDVNSPDKISTSWGAALLPSRTLFELTTGVIFLGLLWCPFPLVSAARDERSKQAGILARPRAVEVSIEKLTQSRSLKIRYRWSTPAGRQAQGYATFSGNRQPFWLNAAKTKLLALTGANDESILPDADLADFDLSDEERARIERARAQDLHSVTQSALEEHIDIASASKLFRLAADLRGLIASGVICQVDSASADTAIDCPLDDIAPWKHWPGASLLLTFREIKTGFIFELRFDTLSGSQHGTFELLTDRA